MKRLGLIAFVLLCVAATTVMKISDFPNTATLNESDAFIVASGLTNKNIRYDQLRALMTNSVLSSRVLVAGANVTITTNSTSYVVASSAGGSIPVFGQLSDTNEVTVDVAGDIYTCMTNYETTVESETDAIVSAADGTITIGVAGDYFIAFSVCFSGSVDETFDFAVHVDGVEQPTISTTQTLPDYNNWMTSSTCGILTLAENAVVTLQVRGLGLSSYATYNRRQLVVKSL